MSSQESANRFSRLSAVLIGICTLPIFLLFHKNSGQALAAYVCVTAIALSAKIFWRLRKRIWFWITLCALSAVHVLIVFRVAWPTAPNHIGQALFPLGLLDVGLICGCIKLVEKVMNRKLRQSDEEHTHAF